MIEYVEVNKRPYAELSKTAKEKKARKARSVIKRIIDDKQKRRDVMHNRLESWGKWKQPLKSRSYATSANTDDNDTDYVGHDHCILSDFDSLMITVDMAVMNLNPIDNKLIKYEYKLGGGAKKWAREFEKSEARYRSRKSELLLYLSYKVKPEQSTNEK